MSQENKQRLLMLFQHHEDLQSCIHPKKMITRQSIPV